MTRFHDPEVYQCAGCGTFALRQQFMSLTFDRAVEWSDGVPTQWWASVNPPLVRCWACNALFWLEDVEAVGVLPYSPASMNRLSRLVARVRGDPHGRLRPEREWALVPDGWKAAQRFDNPDFEDIRHVLANPQGSSRSQLLWLRRQIWWRLNDRFRTRYDGSPIPNVPFIPADEEHANKHAMIALLLQETGESRDDVERGELLRQLGQFDEAVAVLKAVPADGFSEIRASKIAALARAGDVQVRSIADGR